MDFPPNALVMAASPGELHVYRWNAAKKQLRLLESWDFPEEKSRPRKAPVPLSYSRFGHGRSIMEPKHSAQELALMRLARRISRRLSLFIAQAPGKKIVLVAEPKLLGAIRSCLKPSVTEAVVLSLAKNPSGLRRYAAN